MPSADHATQQTVANTNYVIGSLLVPIGLLAALFLVGVYFLPGVTGGDLVVRPTNIEDRGDVVLMQVTYDYGWKAETFGFHDKTLNVIGRKTTTLWVFDGIKWTREDGEELSKTQSDMLDRALEVARAKNLVLDLHKQEEGGGR